MRLATIDIGTNTAQLLVTEVKGDSLRRLHTAERFVRLGEGVDAEGRIRAAAQNRLLAALHEHRDAADEYGADVVSVAGTSALRDAANRQDVLDAIRSEIGLKVEILSGSEEAEWSFAAACAAFDDLTDACLVLDIGGGSTELVAGRAPSKQYPHAIDAITDRVSLNVGCVRLTERCFSSHPPTSEEVDRVDCLIRKTFDDVMIDVGPEPVVIGTAGTATALALVHAGPDCSWNALDGAPFLLSHADVRHWRERLLQLSVEDILALHPDAMAGRADVFPVGVMLLEHVLDHFNVDECRVSPYELRHGLALRERVHNSHLRGDISSQS